MVLAALLALAISQGQEVGAEHPGDSHPLSFWEDIAAKDYALPSAVSPESLMGEVSSFLGSPDPRIRDGYGYGAVAAWMYRDQRLGPEVMRDLLKKWTSNLTVGIGSSGDDSVLLRSFSALDLSILAATDLKRPFLNQGEFETLLESALEYLRAEQDLRAYDERKGWIHATAHTADLLKFLARNARLGKGAQTRIVDAVETKLRSAGVDFTHDEDARLASALASLLLRDDALPSLLEPWLARLQAAFKELWKAETVVDQSLYRSVHNQETCLRDLHAVLSEKALEAPLPPQAEAADRRVLGTLKGL